jgi:hypothetical protein
MTMTSDQAEVEEKPQSALQSILAEACRDLFAAYGIDISDGSSEENGSPLIGRIHFAGRDMSGNLTIGLDREQLKRSLPIETDRQADLEDWVRELANQLMGLVKTQLQGKGINVILSLPLTVNAHESPDGPQWPSRISQFNVSCNFARALSSLDGVLVAEVALAASTPPSSG